jgi:hypothetical protein
MKKTLAYLLFICLGLAARAQDLNARVSVLSPKIQTSNKRVFQSLELAMKDFLNGHKWATDPIQPQEKIDCTFTLNITAWDGSSALSAEMQVQSQRPIYNSGYTTTLLNVNDKAFDFTYTEGQSLDFSDQNFQSNLTAVMAFYAYVIVGMDYDSFAKFSGTPYFASAQNVVTQAQSTSFKGWKAFDGNLSRYWLAENLNSKIYTNLRSFMYDYHRSGLDLMADNPTTGRTVIAGILPTLMQVDRTRVGAMLPTVFFSAKADELVSIFTKADLQAKNQALNVLTQADPANGPKYQALRN